ncbi:MAG: flagellar protein [Defluviitaleaceae bacterium]|nr:flagellar protein [Defluviitaleaceae bacterium]
MQNIQNIQNVNKITTNNPYTPSAPSLQNTGFKDLLEQEIKFSKHANMRLNDREINLSGEQLQRLENGIDSARQKGIRDSLVLVDNVALVVNVNSKTVITALEKEQQNIFTNIDGAVIV